MENIALLLDAFNIYFEKGMAALENNEFIVAKRNILAASETLLKMAKQSKGVVKAERLKRADELLKLAEKIDVQIKNTGKQSATSDLTTFVKKNSKNEYNSNSVNEKDEEMNFDPVYKTGVTLDDVAGMEEAKEEIRRLIVDPIKYPEVYDKFRKNKGGGVLLYGVPGTGKTLLAQAIANEIDAAFFSIKSSDIVSKYFGDAEKNVKKLFDEARKHKAAIIFFDEFEALGTRRDSNSTVMRRLVPELLSQMQGFEKSDNILLLIAATNRPWDIDTAFLRPGRFSTPIYVPLPNDDARKLIINRELKGVPLEDNFNFNEVVTATEGFNGADVVEFCEKLKDLAINRSIKNDRYEQITNEDIEITSSRVSSSVQLEDLEKMAKYQNKS